MVVSTSQTRSFTPEWMGNKDLPAVEQIKVTHKATTIKLKEALFVRQYDFAQDGQNKGMNASMSVKVDRPNVLTQFGVTVENLEYTDEDGNKKKIVTAQQLLDAPIEFDGLVEEIYTYLNELANTQGGKEKN